MNRRQFIPETVWVWDDDDMWRVPLRRQDDPERWGKLCDSDEAIVTQVEDGRGWDGDPNRGIEPSSSSSAPSLMRRMIDALDLEPGMRVLEIGAGTGYNAALITEIVGNGNVTTIEVDHDVARHARRALREAGLDVNVVTGDGAAGHPANAPYDRVIVTASVRDIPYAWVAQTRPGGRILVPWGSDLDHGGVLVALDIDDAGTATGRFGHQVGFMRLRAQRPDAVWWGEDEHTGNYTQTTTRIDPREVFDLASDARFAVGAMRPRFSDGYTRNDDGTHTHRLSDIESGSWAGFVPRDTGEHVVRQNGPRRLWDELENAYAWWIAAGRPGPERFGTTVAPHGRTIWLDTPDNPIGDGS